MSCCSKLIEPEEVVGTSDLQPVSQKPRYNLVLGLASEVCRLSIFSLMSLGQIDVSEFTYVQYFSSVTWNLLCISFGSNGSFLILQNSYFLSVKFQTYFFKAYSFKITAFKLLIVFHTLRFAQFFLCPLFDESCKDREVNAVDSEHEKNVMNDAWRLFQLEKATGNPKHPFSKFGTGLSTAAFMHQFSLTSFKPMASFHSIVFYSSGQRILELPIPSTLFFLNSQS